LSAATKYGNDEDAIWLQESEKPREAIASGDATKLSGRHVGSIYVPRIRYSAGEFSSSQVSAANPLFKGTTGNCRCLLPLLIRRIEGTGNGHKRIPRIPNGDLDREG
jgi:hypothetical protein